MANKFRFTNEKCPVCNNTFNPDDDIVVCPECGTPHHRDCYKENKNCANFHKHSEDFRWEPDFVPVEEIKTEKPELLEGTELVSRNMGTINGYIGYGDEPSAKNESYNSTRRMAFSEIKKTLTKSRKQMFSSKNSCR